MHKWLLFIFFLSSVSVSGQHKKGDTVFISKHITDSDYYVVYILKDPQSKYYRHLADLSFIFDRRDSASFAESILPLKNDSHVLIKNFPIGPSLPRHWCNLYLRNGHYYLYAPCDWGNNDRFIISDSALVNYFMEGPYAYLINTYVQVDKNTFDFGVKSAYRTITKFRLHIIDWKRQIAVLDNGIGDGAGRYTLMVGADKARDFPIIVNDCRTNKWIELDFDTPDFEKILAHGFKAENR